MTRTLTTVLAATTLASLPILVGAQGAGTAPAPRPESTTSQQSKPADQNSPQYHLDQAKRALESINSSSMKGESRTEFAELRQHFNLLESSWRTKAASGARGGASGSTHAGGHVSTPTSTAGTTSGTAAATIAGTTGSPEQPGATGTPMAQPAPGTDSLMAHYQAITGILDRLTIDNKAGASDSKVDSSTRTKLAEFRKHLEAFHTTAMAQGKVSERSAVSPENAGATYPSPATAASGTTSAGTSTTATTGAVGTSGTTSGTASSASPTAPPTPKDPIAPESMSSAPQTGANASQSANVDSATIAGLTAQIDQLLAGASANATAGTVCVDRAKLEQLKKDVQALKKVR